jgi:hypothetical protein
MWNEVVDPSYSSNPEKVFVFGSNLAGRHGKGAALWAVHNRGARNGQGYGEQGNSFAIPTKDKRIQTLPLDIIANYVKLFIEEARINPEVEYELTPIGCGLAGYKPEQIAPMFKDAPSNVELPLVFVNVLKD